MRPEPFNIFDPAIFNNVMMVLQACAAVRWAVAGKWADALYWVFAVGITAVITYGYKR